MSPDPPPQHGTGRYAATDGTVVGGGASARPGDRTTHAHGTAGALEHAPAPGTEAGVPTGSPEVSPRPDAVDAIVAQWAEVRPELETTSMALFGRIYRVSQTMSGLIEKAYAPSGISRGEFDVLATLRRSGVPYTLSPRQLSATLMLTTGGMTGRLDKLERAGLVSRSPDPSDRRGLRVTLTEQGLRVVDEAVVAGLRTQRRAAGDLSEEEQHQLIGLLRKLVHSVGQDEGLSSK